MVTRLFARSVVWANHECDLVRACWTSYVTVIILNFVTCIGDGSFHDGFAIAVIFAWTAAFVPRVDIIVVCRWIVRWPSECVRHDLKSLFKGDAEWLRLRSGG